MDQKNKERQTAIVNGVSSGIGLSITRLLLEHGYRVVANSRTISKSKELLASKDLVLVDGDISQKDTAVKVADAGIGQFGRIDLLVNNAGIYMPKPFSGTHRKRSWKVCRRWADLLRRSRTSRMRWCPLPGLRRLPATPYMSTGALISAAGNGMEALS